MLGKRRSLALALFALLLMPAASALAQPSEEGDELPPGHPSRSGSYAWEDGGAVEAGASGGAPAEHRYARIFLSVGAGLTFRTLIYVDELNHDPGGLAPWYLQLRGAYFFEGDGDLQHGIGLGISTNLTGDGLVGVVDEAGCARVPGSAACTPAGLDPLAAWTFVPGYHLRVWFMDWVQLMARVGLGVTAADLPNLGFEVGVGAVAKFLAGMGIYLEASFSTYFATQAHPLISVEAGLVVDYELLP